jgi:molybdopterin converting factor small subunit
MQNAHEEVAPQRAKSYLSHTSAREPGVCFVTIELRLFGELGEYMPDGVSGRRARIEIPDRSDVMGLIDHLGIPYEVEEGAIVVAINDEVADHHAPIREGDVVSMFPPLAGG